MHITKRLILVVIMLSLDLSACMPQGVVTIQTVTPTSVPEPTHDYVTPSPGAPTMEYPKAVTASVKTLSKLLEISDQQIQVISFQEVEWRDSCLGITIPKQMCADVITPGWLVVLGYKGTKYEFHTDLTGLQIRYTPFKIK